jgi:hypothetical protein
MSGNWPPPPPNQPPPRPGPPGHDEPTRLPSSPPPSAPPSSPPPASPWGQPPPGQGAPPAYGGGGGYPGGGGGYGGSGGGGGGGYGGGGYGGGGYGGPQGPSWGQPPPKKSKAKLIVALSLVVVLIAVLSVGGWLYTSGRLGFGPLSAKDEAAADAIADGVEGPEWASAKDKQCAADQMVEDGRAERLEKAGLVDPKGDGWTYTGTWKADEAEEYGEAVLDCAKDWPDKIGELWSLDDTECLGDIDEGAISDYFIAESLEVEDAGDIDNGREDAVEALDECYVAELSLPAVQKTPAYRAVKFTFGEVEGAESSEVMVRDAGGEYEPLSGNSRSVDTGEGGKQGCVELRVEASYPWGTSSQKESRVCGNSKPKKLFWKRAPGCDYTPGCFSWALRYEGFESFDTGVAKLTENGGSCESQSGNCDITFFVPDNGKGTAVTFSFPPGWNETFVGKVGPLSATIPN